MVNSQQNQAYTSKKQTILYFVIFSVSLFYKEIKHQSTKNHLAKLILMQSIFFILQHN